MNREECLNLAREIVHSEDISQFSFNEDLPASIISIRKLHHQTKGVQMNREECLYLAMERVYHDRVIDYGEPEDNFAIIAAYWATYLQNKLLPGADISAADVAAMAALIKISRIQKTPSHEDSWVDLAGYAACGVECATKKEN